MVAFNKKTPTKPVTINGEQYPLPCPFTEGHPLTANEADQLNQVLHENVRNNMASKWNKLDEPLSADEALAQTLEYLKEYEFGVRRGGGGRVADPVEREARQIGKDKIKQALKRKGIALPDAAGLNALVDNHWPQYGEAWMARAREIIAIRKASGEDTLDLDAADVEAVSGEEAAA